MVITAVEAGIMTLVTLLKADKLPPTRLAAAGLLPCLPPLHCQEPVLLRPTAGSAIQHGLHRSTGAFVHLLLCRWWRSCLS